MILYIFFFDKICLSLKTGVFLLKEYISARGSGSDIELESSQVPQNTHLSKNETRIDSTEGCC